VTSPHYSQGRNLISLYYMYRCTEF
jgi:hypothetical protein